MNTLNVAEVISFLRQKAAALNKAADALDGLGGDVAVIQPRQRIRPQVPSDAALKERVAARIRSKGAGRAKEIAAALGVSKEAVDAELLDSETFEHTSRGWYKLVNATPIMAGF